MVEAIHTTETMFGSRRSKGRGGKLWAGAIILDDSETLNTGMDHIEGAAFITVEGTDIDDNSPGLWIKSISGGTITFMTGEIGLYTNVSNVVAYGVVIGRVD